ncbi:putative cytochrome P450 [Lyophyllum shimeji]|uniref:Cytochrome P450 n=1 Tax=Lyophyllum shimeji TaxID=47721 RepID=A0A9P3UQK3_LYOSH|nr:putative cytochrome P450 [Lyophyllum shimeji]
MTCALSALFLNFIISAVSSLWFRKHEPHIFTFLAVCLVIACVHAAHHIALAEAGFARVMTFVSCQLTIYLVFLSLLTLEYRLSSRHPLARFPGPAMAKVSKWYMAYHVLVGTRHAILQRLHAQFGPWVRIGPNELSINDADAVKPIYLNLPRAASYKAVPARDQTLIMIVDRQQHTQRRKPWTRAFSSKMLAKYAVAASNRARQLAAILQGRSLIDLNHWLALCLMDIIGDLGFSGGIEALAAGEDRADWMNMLNLGALVVGVLGQVPWLTDFVLLFPQNGPLETFHKFARDKVESARAKALSEDANILSIILNDNVNASSQSSLSTGEAAADASLLMASSIETTSQALTTLFRYVLTDDSILGRLRAEIAAAFPDGDEDINVTYRDAHKTVFLNACIQEALRIMPPAPAGLPRSSGAHGVTIIGEFIPPETTVHVPTFTLQRTAANFAEPDRFIPTRWLPSERNSTPHNELAYIPFGAGFGACVGRQLALQNIRILAIHLLSKLDIKLSTGLSLNNFDASHKDRGLWTHDKFLVDVEKRL